MAAGTAGPGTQSVERFKESFFDADKVIKAMDRATRKVFSKFGAFVRRRAQTSIRYRNKPAPPGQPPSAHRTGMKTKTNRRTGVSRVQPSSPLRDLIFFAYNADTQSVIIGPAIFPGSSPRRLQPTRGTVPQTLEVGGTLQSAGRALYMAQEAGRGAGGRFISRGKRRVQLKGNLRIDARPFMAPALAAELPNLTPMYEHAF